MAVLMIVLSDNIATAAVVDLVGADNVARLVEDLGLGDTRVLPGFGRWPRDQGSADPESSARDLCLLLTRIYRNEILNPASCREIVRIMRAQLVNHGLPRYIPVGQDWGDAAEWIANKTGSGRCSIETGIVHQRDLTFALAVFFDPKRRVTFPFKCRADFPPVLAVAAACRLVYEFMRGTQEDGR
jgi:hypothetical protein